VSRDSDGMTNWHITPTGLEELRVGGYLTINGERRRIIAYSVEPATEADPELGVEIGDPLTTVELAPPEPA